MSVKQLEKKVESLQTKRTKAVGALAAIEDQLGPAFAELSEARKNEPLTKQPNKPKARTQQAEKHDEAE